MNENPLASPLAASSDVAKLLDAPETVRGERKRTKRELKNLLKRNGIWEFKQVVNGKRTRLSLGTRDLTVAKAKRDALLKANNGAEVDRVLGRSSKPPAKMKEIFEAYRKAPTVRANAATRERNITDAVRMIRLVKGADYNVEEMGSELLTKLLVKEWQTLRLTAAVKECAGDLAGLEAAKRTINSLLTHVQSLFSREARDDYGALHVPACVTGFTEAMPIAARKQEEPTQLTDEAVATLVGKLDREPAPGVDPGLKQVDAGSWATFQLMTWGGLRNKECLYARESWLERVALGYRLTMKPDKKFLPKGNSRSVILPADIVDSMLALLPPIAIETGKRPDDHLVTGRTFRIREDAVYRRLNDWLKRHGVAEDAGKIAYRLRKYFLNKVAEQQGVFLAQAAAGHAKLATTEDHYIGRKKMSEPIKLAAG